jgi:hypothetical protein
VTARVLLPKDEPKIVLAKTTVFTPSPEETGAVEPVTALN